MSDEGQVHLDAFGRRFGAPHLIFAMHASLPLGLTAELLYRLWTRFAMDRRGQGLGVPWVAVADLLLSPLCREVGGEVYQMDGAARQVLLDRLRADRGRFGPERIRELAAFLMEYVEPHRHSRDRNLSALAQAQRWSALAETEPREAAADLARALQVAAPWDTGEHLRLRAVAEELRQPMAGYPELLAYSQVVADLSRGRLRPDSENPAVAYLRRQAGEAGEMEVAGVRLVLPGVRAEREGLRRPKEGPVSVFVIWVEGDRDHWERLRSHLVPLERREEVQVGSQSDLRPGEDSSSFFRRWLEEAELILVLVSAALLASDRDFELTERGLALQQGGRAILLPVLVRPMDVSGLDSIEGLLVNREPISLLADPDVGWVDVVRRIGTAVDSLRPQRRRATTEEPQAPQALRREGHGPINLFIIDAPEDAELRTELEQHMSVLRRTARIVTPNSRRDLRPWDGESAPVLRRWLEEAELILVLLSPHCLSDPVTAELIGRAVERAAHRQLAIVPVMLRAVELRGSGLEPFQRLPRDGMPVVGWPQRDVAWFEVLQGINRVMDELRPQSKTQPDRPQPGQPFQRKRRGPILTLLLSPSPFSSAEHEMLSEMSALLAPLERSKAIVLWEPGRIGSGSQIDKQVTTWIDEADLVLVPVSAAILSDEVWNVWLHRALRRRESGEAILVPVILRPLDLAGSGLESLEPLPRSAGAVSTWRNRDRAWEDVVAGIREVVDSMTSGSDQRTRQTGK